MTGHIRQRGKKSWELKFDADRDPATGKRKIQYVSFKGTKREAQIELARLFAAVGDASYVEPSKLSVAEHMSARIDHWESSKAISARTAQRYRQLLDGQIRPHIGARLVQKLSTVDVEKWHATLKTGGRRRGNGGIASRTVVHAHRLLAHALDDAMRHSLVRRGATSPGCSRRLKFRPARWQSSIVRGSLRSSRSCLATRCIPRRSWRSSPGCASARSWRSAG